MLVVDDFLTMVVVMVVVLVGHSQDLCCRYVPLVFLKGSRIDFIVFVRVLLAEVCYYF